MCQPPEFLEQRTWMTLQHHIRVEWGVPGALQATDAYKEALRVYEEHAGAAMALVKLHLAQGQAVDGQVRAASDLICNTRTADVHPLHMPEQWGWCARSGAHSRSGSPGFKTG